MPDFTRDEAVAFIESMRLTLVNRVGFRWMVERLSGLAAFIESIADENERLNAYLDWANARGDFEAHSVDDSGPREHNPGAGDTERHNAAP